MPDNVETHEEQEAINEIKSKIENTENELAAYKSGYTRLQESVYHLVQKDDLMDADGVRSALSHEDETFEDNYRQGQREIDDLEEDYWRVQENILNCQRLK